MPLPIFELPDGKQVKLGRIKPKEPVEVLRFVDYLDPTKTVPPPAEVDYSLKAVSAVQQMYLNNQLGCCVISSVGHQLGIWSGNDSDSGGVIVASNQEIQNAYRIWNPGRQDNGCVITDVLDYWRDKGLTLGGSLRKIDGYVAVDWTNPVEVKTVINLFGSVRFGINLPEAWLDSEEGGLWDVTETQIMGGHDVPAVGYNSTGVVICTWGGLRTITWAAMSDPRFLEEAYCELSPNWYNSDKLAPSGLDVDALSQDLEGLGAGSVPPIPDPDPPLPPVPPVPSVPPSPPIPPSPTTTFPVTGIVGYVLSPIAGHREPVVFESMGSVDLTPPVQGDMVEFDGGVQADNAEAILKLFGTTPTKKGSRFRVTRPKSITPAQWAAIIAAIFSILAAFGILPAPVPTK